jgi:hypothetical protein
VLQISAVQKKAGEENNMKKLDFNEIKKNILNDDYEERLNFLENYHFKNLLLEEVKYFFEHKSYEVRQDFMEFYHFNDNYYNYYKEFIINFEKTNNVLYFTDLIELAIDLQIVDDRLFSKYFDLLNQKSHYLTKIYILKYFLELIHLYKTRNNELNELYQNLIHTYQIRGVKLDILLNLMHLHKTNNKYKPYFLELERLLKLTKNISARCRVLFSFTVDGGKFHFVQDNEILELIDIVEKNNISDAEREAIETCKLYLKNRNKL